IYISRRKGFQPARRLSCSARDRFHKVCLISCLPACLHANLCHLCTGYRSSSSSGRSSPSSWMSRRKKAAIVKIVVATSTTKTGLGSISRAVYSIYSLSMLGGAEEAVVVVDDAVAPDILSLSCYARLLVLTPDEWRRTARVPLQLLESERTVPRSKPAAEKQV